MSLNLLESDTLYTWGLMSRLYVSSNPSISWQALVRISVIGGKSPTVLPSFIFSPRRGVI